MILSSLVVIMMMAPTGVCIYAALRQDYQRHIQERPATSVKIECHLFSPFTSILSSLISASRLSSFLSRCSILSRVFEPDPEDGSAIMQKSILSESASFQS
jgi:hypothetical protein